MIQEIDTNYIYGNSRITDSANKEGLSFSSISKDGNTGWLAYKWRE
jgi:hypothetical protein